MKRNATRGLQTLLLGLIPLAGWVGSAVITLTPVPALAGPLDLNGFVTPGDAACWTNPNCSLPRGGNSDVMTVNGPDGAIVAQNFAFGNEENNNIYYFDPAQVAVDPSMYGQYTTLLEPNGSWSDTFGVAWFVQDIGGGAPIGVQWSGPVPILPGFDALAFMSDSQASGIPPTLNSYIEQAGILNPVPEPGDSSYLTLAYDATSYLAPSLQATGYTANFRSDVPEPATLALFGIGLAGLAGARRRRPG